MVKGQFHRDWVVVPVGVPDVVVEGGVGVSTLGEPATGGIEADHLIRTPPEVVSVVASLHPVDSQVGASVPGASHCIGVVGRKAEVLQPSSGHPPPSAEAVRAGHAPAVEVVPLIPAVVRHFVAPFRINQGEEHAPDRDRILGGTEPVHGLPPDPDRRASMRMEEVPRPIRPDAS